MVVSKFFSTRNQSRDDPAADSLATIVGISDHDWHEINVKNHYYNIEQLKKLRAQQKADEKAKAEIRAIEDKKLEEKAEYIVKYWWSRL